MVLGVKHGLVVNAFNAQLDGTSMNLTPADLFQTYADHGHLLEIVNHATQVMLSPKDDVFKILTHSSQP